ncbi:MAG: 2-polyprenyl-6-hydroxyphenyl methylase/3-demethylubiquinone-9 3-methyltransferase [Paraglaciecola sp.]|jgi:2-polyprenyl-6-hydroxyphenyl methylase/3-demethylubiquinone-9 3-methyltransferase
MNTAQNVDAAEIQKFAALASRWWDKEGEFKPLHEINPLRTDFISQYADGLQGKLILDVGCGGGILTESMARAGAEVTGIDMGEEPLQVARLHSLESQLNVDYQLSTAEQFAQSHPEKYDIVTCMEMLEHVPDPASVIQACGALVKPGGKVFFSTLNRNIKSYLMAIIGAEYVLRLVPKGTHNHKKFIKPSELLSWVDQTQLVAKNITGLHLNPITQQFYLSEQNVDVNYIVHCQHVGHP